MQVILPFYILYQPYSKENQKAKIKKQNDKSKFKNFGFCIVILIFAF